MAEKTKEMLMELKDIKPTKSIKAKTERKPVMTLILILLILQVAMSGYQLYRDIQSDIDRAQVKESVSAYTNNVDVLIENMLTDYKNDVYNNPNVDTTAKQAVMASEYNFNASMLLVKQINRLFERIMYDR